MIRNQKSKLCRWTLITALLKVDVGSRSHSRVPDFYSTFTRLLIQIDFTRLLVGLNRLWLDSTLAVGPLSQALVSNQLHGHTSQSFNQHTTQSVFSTDPPISIYQDPISMNNNILSVSLLNGWVSDVQLIKPTATYTLEQTTVKAEPFFPLNRSDTVYYLCRDSVQN